MRKVNRRYYMEFVPAMLAYVLIMLFVWPRVPNIESIALRGLAALLPVLPTIFIVRAIIRRITGGDELERQLALESMGIATTVVGLVSFAAAFLVIAKVIDPGAEILILVLPALLGVYGLARLLLTARYSRS